jgi:hypothetical protein
MRTFDLVCALVSVALPGQAADPRLVAAVAAPDPPWRRLVTLSGIHLLTPALSPALRHDELRQAVPAELEDYLAAMHEAAAQRNDALLRQLEEVAAELNAIGVVPVALKGAIRLIDGLWPDPALRFMHDLDLLVPEATLPDCAAALAACGWSPAADESGEADHHVSLYHPEATARVELHRLPLAAPHQHLLTAEGMIAGARPMAVGRAIVAVPALADQIVHLVAHGMLQHAFLENGRFLLRDLVEQRLLTARAGRGDLAAVRERFRAAGHPLAWDVSRALCARCLGGPMPAVGWPSRALAARMLLQQRSAWAMQALGPAGWLAARLLRVRAAHPAPVTLTGVFGRLAMFRRKTLW